MVFNLLLFCVSNNILCDGFLDSRLPQLRVWFVYRLLLVGVAKMPMIKLQSSDGEIFEVEVEIAKASNTIKTMIEGQCTPCGRWYVFAYTG